MQPLILSYNFPARHLSKLRMLAIKLGARVRVVEKRAYLDTIGSLCGVCGAFETMYDGENFPGLMLVMAHFSDAQLSAFLQALRASKLPPVPLKAVLTEENKGWNSLELHEALLAEHTAMQSGAPIHEQSGPSENN